MGQDATNPPLPAASAIRVLMLEDARGGTDVLGIALQFPPDLFYPKGLAVVASQKYGRGIVDPHDCHKWADTLRRQLTEPRTIKTAIELEHRQRLANINWQSVAAAIQRHIQDFNVKRWKLTAAESEPTGRMQ